MDILPSGNIFRELQDIHDTGYFSSQFSVEDQWQQASAPFIPISNIFYRLKNSSRTFGRIQIQQRQFHIHARAKSVKQPPVLQRITTHKNSESPKNSSTFQSVKHTQ